MEKLKTTAGGSTTQRSMMLATRNSEQTGMTTNSVWSLDTTNKVVGDNITRNGATITLREKRTYKITFKMEPASVTSGNWVRYGIFNVTTASWQPNQSYASHWQGNSTGTSGYGPNGTGIVFIDTTVQTDIQMRCIYAGNSHNIRGGLDTTSDAGDSYILVEEISGDEIIDARNTVILQGDRVDYLMAKLSTNLTGAGTSTQYDLPFNSNVVSIGEVVNNNGVFRLKANKTYELLADVFTNIGGSGRFAYAWHDVNNVRLSGTIGAKVAAPSTENFAPQNIARTVITPSVDMDVKVRVTYDTGGSHTIYADDPSLGSSYAIVKQLGSSKVTTSEIVVSPNDPKNYWTRDVINPNYDVSKHLTDWYFATFIGDLSSMAVALKVGESAAEKQARAWYLYQKFNTYLCGTIDNDNTFDGLLGEAGRVMNTVPAMMNAGRFGGNAINGMALSDVDPTLTSGSGTTPAPTGSATEYFKLCLGRDNANNIHWITVCPMKYWDTSAQREIPSLMVGLAFWNGSAWAFPGGGGVIPVYSATSFIGTGTATQSNNICLSGSPIVQYLPHRLELA
ncbi:hypothetical protein phiAS5_ORF0153 [Aeromonas phage phiAS5]|uniref:Uncharacterized protein n=1 Tax=Aeromonas phage phiAS5 TaxID=879630 RepID=E1A2Q0_9CAUD|nr:hypothetical protein phiAS5_ORF0153 [Aeromonas phage phiAS5]ADM79996.1 hypothetical protein phiAS5_ORF0153 [Aeromonas phage phiAS5]